MKKSFAIFFTLALLLVSCNEDLKTIDFNRLPKTYMNVLDDSEWKTFRYQLLPSNVEISSSTNKFGLANDLLDWGDSMLLDVKKSKHQEGVMGEWSELCQFTNGVITNENRFKMVEFELENATNDILKITHVSTEFAIKSDEYIYEKSSYRYNCMLKYHFKMMLNPNGEKCEAMRHLVFLDDYVIYSPTKMKCHN